MRFRRLFILVFVLILVLQFPGEPAHSAYLQTSSVSISMSNPTCEEALPASGSCEIEVGSLTASGSGSFSRVEVLINGKLRVLEDGFFESTAYFSPQMVPGGLKVSCGRPNDGGLPNYGRSYVVTANAYLVDGTSSTDSMTVFCPAYDGKIYIPVMRKN